MSFLENIKFKYLKNAHVYNPLIPVLILAFFVYRYYQTDGFPKTKRVRDNVAFIYNFENVFNDVLDTDTSLQAFKKKMIAMNRRDSLEEFHALLEEQANAWPIALLSDNIFNDVFPPGLIQINGQTHSFTYSDKLVYSIDSGEFLLEKNFHVHDTLFPAFDQRIDDRIDFLVNAVIPDSLYLLYMEEWAGTDSINVRIKKIAQ